MTEIVTNPVSRLHSILRQTLRHVAGQLYRLNPDHPDGRRALAGMGTETVRVVAIHIWNRQDGFQDPDVPEETDFVDQDRSVMLHVTPVPPSQYHSGVFILPPKALTNLE